jgi:hypothetical protein
MPFVIHKPPVLLVVVARLIFRAEEVFGKHFVRLECEVRQFGDCLLLVVPVVELEEPWLMGFDFDADNVFWKS